MCIENNKIRIKKILCVSFVKHFYQIALPYAYFIVIPLLILYYLLYLYVQHLSSKLASFSAIHSLTRSILNFKY